MSDYAEEETVNYALHDAAERGDAAAITAALEAEEDAEYNPDASPLAATFLSIGAWCLRLLPWRQWLCAARRALQCGTRCRQRVVGSWRGPDLAQLHFACAKRLTSVVSRVRLVSRGADAVDRMGCTPLHVAVLSKSLPAVTACIAQGAEMLMHLAGLPYLHVALSMGAVPANRDFVDAVIPVLVGAGALWGSTDRFGRTALHVAATHGLLAHVEKAIEADADLITALDSRRCTPLHYATMCVRDSRVRVPHSLHDAAPPAFAA